VNDGMNVANDFQRLETFGNDFSRFGFKIPENSINVSFIQK
jgi:hypothetical protein